MVSSSDTAGVTKMGSCIWKGVGDTKYRPGPRGPVVVGTIHAVAFSPWYSYIKSLICHLLFLSARALDQAWC